MSEKYNGGPAFPVHPESRYDEPHAGMTLRDWFAGQALTGILFEQTYSRPPRDDAARAYRLADAMIAERSK